jgi:RNA polymerase sigma-70 factor, ECF subfamily
LDQSKVDQPSGEITGLLHRWSTGDRGVEDRLFDLVVPDLHKLAHYLMRRERKDHSLQATALLNEAYLRLAQARQLDWQNRKHFFAVAARSMRRLLIDHSRGRMPAQKVELTELLALLPGPSKQLDEAIAIDSLLQQIESTHPEWCSIIDLKFFLGFTDEEAAEALGMSLRSLQRQYGDARRWLYEKLQT